MTKQVPVKVVTQDEVLLANCDEAAKHYEDAWVELAKSLYAVKMKQAYHARGFGSFEDYIGKTFTFKIRTAHYLMKAVGAFKDAGVNIETVEKTKAYALAPVLTKRNAPGLVKYAQTATVEEVKNRVAEIAGSTKRFHLGFLFNDEADFNHVGEVLTYIGQKEGTLSPTAQLVYLADAYWAEHHEGADVDLEDQTRTHPMSDPVSEAVISRDGRWRWIWGKWEWRRGLCIVGYAH